MAATADLPGATYVGPGGLGEMGGHPQVVTTTKLSDDGRAAPALGAQRGDDRDQLSLSGSCLLASRLTYRRTGTDTVPPPRVTAS